MNSARFEDLCWSEEYVTAFIINGNQLRSLVGRVSRLLSVLRVTRYKVMKARYSYVCASMELAGAKDHRDTDEKMLLSLTATQKRQGLTLNNHCQQKQRQVGL